MNKLVITVAIAAALSAVVWQDAGAEDFYANKTITIVTSTGAGGGYDLIARTLARYMPQYLPGNPKMIVQNMPGGGHMLATNFMYNVAPKDGTHMATVNQNIPSQQVFGAKGVRYDARRFNWIGSLDNPNVVITVWHDAGVDTIGDAMKRDVITGATGDGSSAYRFPVVMNKVLGTRFKMVKGYKSGPEVFLAMQRGEVQARGSGYQALVQQYPEWITEKKVKFIVQIGRTREKEIPDVPLWTELAKTEEQRQILQMVTATVSLGRPFLVPPDVPSERVALLRKAFDEAVKSKEFLEEAERQNFVATGINGEQAAKIVEETINAPPEIVAKAKEAMEN